MGFADDVRRFQGKAGDAAQQMHRGVVELAFQSIVEGSPVTGAPGQPVDTGNLKGSWQHIPEGPTTSLIATKVLYAPQIEDGTRAGRSLVLRSAVGGFHSVKLTVAGWARIVEQIAREVTRA